MPKSKAKPRDPKLYQEVVRAASRKFKEKTSAYRSMWIAGEYKRRGGKYAPGSRTSNLKKWRQEVWVQVEPFLLNKKMTLACGKGAHNKACRPLRRIDKTTPPTLPELLKKHGRKTLLRLARAKAKDMSVRVNWKAGTVRVKGGGKTVRVTDKMGGKRSYTLSAPRGKRFHKGFKPRFTPKQMLRMGVFEGRYLNSIRKEFPAAWFTGARLATTKGADPKLNYFGVKSRSSLGTWRRNGWINQTHDPRGWFQWYCRYWMGRRIPGEDERQIKRWKSFGARHKGQILAAYKRGTLSRPRGRPAFKTSRPKQRQGLLQWAHDPFV